MPLSSSSFFHVLLFLSLSSFVGHAYQPPPPPGPSPLRSRAAHLQHALGSVVAGAALSVLPFSPPSPAHANIVDVGLRKKYIDGNEFWQLDYPAGWYLSRRDAQSQGAAAQAGLMRASTTLLVVADYSSGATASVVKTNLADLVKEGMGWGTLMPQFGGLGPVAKFEDVLEGQGVAALLMRDRDGQLKVSALSPPKVGSMLESEIAGNDGFLSKLAECTPKGLTMEFKVKTPVNRIPTRGGGALASAASAPAADDGGGDLGPQRRGRPLRQASDVLGAIGDASPIERRANPSSESVSTMRGNLERSTLVRQQADVRVSKAKAYLREDGSVLTAWVSADRRSWEDPDAAARLDAILESFDIAPR